jgi:hypothetical protein
MNRRASPKSACRASTNRRFFHRAQVDVVRSSQMVEAFGHAPRTCLGTPTASLFGEVFHEHPRVALS